MTHQIPFDWHEILTGRSPNEKRRRSLGEAGELGVFRDPTVPIDGPYEQLSSITVSMSRQGKLADRMIQANPSMAKMLSLRWRSRGRSTSGSAASLFVCETPSIGVAVAEVAVVSAMQLAEILHRTHTPHLVLEASPIQEDYSVRRLTCS